MTDLNALSIFNGNSTFHNGINNAADLASLGINDMHDAYRWYNDHVQFVPHNSIRVLRVAQATWTFSIDLGTDKVTYRSLNSRTGNMKILPKLRKSPVSTNAYAKFLRHLATGATVNNIDRAHGADPDIAALMRVPR